MKNKITKLFRNIGKIVLYFLFYSILAFLLASSLYVIFKLTKEVFGNSDNKTQILLGIAPTLLSAVICITGLATFTISLINNGRKKKYNKIEKTNEFIKLFNEKIIYDLNITTRIINSTNAIINTQVTFKPLLVDQKDAFESYNDFLTKNNISYKETLFYSAATVFLVENNELTSDMIKYCNAIINAGLGKLSSKSNTLGTVQLLYLFKRKRISVLNYFENLAICYINETVNTNLVDEQFKIILESIIPLFYYEIYRLEKINSYPYLNRMLKIMLEDKIVI